MARPLQRVAAAALAAGLGGCAGGPEAPGPIRVAVSVPPQAYFVDRIGGERVAVEVMVPPGAAPDSYEPSPQQILALRQARLYVKVGHAGFPFETRYLEVPAAARSGAGPALELVDMSRGIDLLPAPEAFAGEASGIHAHGNIDPHVWVAPAAVAVAAENIAAALTRIDPAGTAVYRDNLAAFLADVAALDRDVRAELAGVARRRFLVYHPSWGYFAREYGLEQVAIESEGKDPSPAHVVALVEEARREGIRTVFVQRGFSDRAARVIAAELGAEVVVLDPLAYDWLANLREVAKALRRALLD